MSTASPAPAPAPGANPSRGRNLRRGGPRRGRGGAGAGTTTTATAPATTGPEIASGGPQIQAHGANLALRPAQVAGNGNTATGASTNNPGNPGRGGRRNRGGNGNGASNTESIPAQVPGQTPNPSSNNTDRGGRGRRGVGRGRGRGNGPLMVDGRRAFGGQLTSNANTSTTSLSASLAADAAEFVPGQPVASRARPQKAPRARRLSKSQAPDIATRTHEDISNGQYECVICTNEVMPNSKIWTCKTCWSVVHLSCVKKWSQNEVSTHQQRAAENGDLPPARRWRCPGCNLPKDELPNTYTCWCGKETDPKSLPGLPPHSCAQTCAKARVGHCPHPCELMCHAGPCPPCGHMGPEMACFCGKEASARRCLDTNYDSGWTCGQVCGDILPCGEHECQRGCHEGLCGSCEVLVDSKCYCGREEKALECFERGDEQTSNLEEDSWTGSFVCGVECKRPFDCGKPDHYCHKICHVQDALPEHCPLSPDVVTHCPCGKTSVDVLLQQPREDCGEPIPHCKQKCEKLLTCGHLCKKICHEGECGYCLENVTIACRCGRTNSNTVCDQGTGEPPLCPRICRSTLNCGRHECGERCCAGEKKAGERQASKRKHRALTAAPRIEGEIEAEHICLRTCGRPLKCGNHTCEQLCHKGPCGNCLEAVFDEISCACGRTVLYPPQPCGSRPPECRHECTRERTCGHPQIKHHCHEDSESCPKCPFLMEKPCCCGKRNLKNQPCWFTEVKCGLPCGKRLKCGIHFCQSLCHRPGRCEDATSACVQLCGRKKTVCDHTCSDACHAPYPCKETTPCQAKTFMTCPCQNQKQPVKCLASKTSEGNTTKVLECNDECLRLQRNAKLAAALNIDPATHLDDHIPYSQTTLDMFRDAVKFSQSYEREFRVFAADDREKRLRFKPMPPTQRAFIHSLAADFGMDSESQDPEPHRHVSIFKTPRFVSAPMKTLSQSLKLKLVPEVVVAASKPLVTTAEPFNAFVLENPKFGCTIDELRDSLAGEFTAGNEITISFLPSGEVILKATSTSWGAPKLEPALIAMKGSLSRKVKSLDLAREVALCAVDRDGNVLRREDEAGGGGWNQVAKGGAGRGVQAVQRGVGQGSTFTVLGRKLREKEAKKGKDEEAPDDWEREVEGWEA